MTRPMSWAMTAAIANRSPLILLSEIEHPDGTGRFWSGVGDLEYGTGGRPVIDLDFANDRYYGATLEESLTCTRASATNYAQRVDGSFAGFSANQLRRTDKGILIEGACVNLIFQNDITAAVAPNTNVLATDIPQLFPGVGVRKHTRDTGTGDTAVGVISPAIVGWAFNTTYTFSVWIYIPTNTNITGVSVQQDQSGAPWASGSFTTSADLTIRDRWQQVSTTVTTTGSGANNPRLIIRLTATTGSVIYTTGYQMENSLNATSFIPTTTAAVARNADVIAINGTFKSLMRGANGTVLVKNGPVQANSGAVFGRSIGSNTGGTHSQAYTGGINSAGNANVVMYNSITQATATVGHSKNILTSSIEEAGAWAPNNVSVTSEGSTVATANLTMYADTDYFLGSVNSSGDSALWGYFQRVAVWDEKIPDAELINLTFNQDAAPLLTDNIPTWVVYNGTLTWAGTSILGSVSPIKHTSDIAIQEIEFTLAGVDPTVLSQLSDNVRNLAGRCWLACLDDRGNVIADPFQVVDSQLDYQSNKISEDGVAVIVITARTGFYTLERAINDVWSAEDQKARFPGDSGLDLISSLQNQTLIWAPT